MNDLAKRWLDAKAAEKAANAERIAIEAELLATFDELPEEGTTKREADGYRITATARLTRSVDTKALQASWQTLPSDMQQCFTWKAALDTRSFKKLDNTQALADFVTSKPAKTAISVAPLEQES